MSDGSQQGAPVGFNPFAGGVLSRVVPTTEPQREIWLADRLGRDASLAYNESVSLELTGVLDAAALLRGVQALVDRHDALRANFGPDGETLCVRERLQLDIARFDFSSLDVAAREAALAERRQLAVDTPFGLDSDVLFRAELVRLEPQRHVLMLTAHHAVCDGWSWWVLVRELGALYTAYRAGTGPVLAEPEPFADYALAQARRPASADASELAWWRARFASDVPALDLPTDRPRAAHRSFASLREDYTLEPALVTGLRRLGAQRGASLFATLLTGFATLVSRLSGQSSVVVGIPAAIQGIDGHDGLVGHCVNLLPLRFDLDATLPFETALKAGQEVLLDALDHPHCTFGTLLQSLPLARDPSRLPLVSVMFNIDQALDHEAEDFAGLRLRFTSNPRSHENFELFVNAVQEAGALRLECQYNRDLFDAGTVRRWLASFETLLRGAVDAPGTEAGALGLLDRAALDELRALQPAATAFDREHRVHEFLEAQADATPERIAVQAGSKSLTYAQLDARANRIAQLLRARGVHHGSLVGLALDRDADMLAAVLGTLKAGAGYVPLDPGLPDERLAYMVADAGLSTLLTQSAHVGRFDLRGRPVLALDTLADELAALPDARIGRDAHAAQPDSLAYVLYTSGSTGRPKGVQVPHRTLSNFITAMQAEPGLAADDVLVSVTTLSFDIAFLELMLPLSVGARVVLASRDQQRDGRALRALLESSGATCLQATPAGWRLLLESGWEGRPGFKAITGGEPLALDLAQALLARCGEVWNAYGPTETTIWSTLWRVAAPENGIRVGRPIANTQAWVLDPAGRLVPRGVPGELWLGGEGVATGYLGRDELTRERFIPDPFSDTPGARLYRTGDRVRWHADGTLEHMGRLDFQVKVRGYRIEPGEIEAVLLTHPDVARAAVLAREDRPGDVRLVAYCVGRAPLDVRDLEDHLRRSLPDYMVPAHFVVLDAFPLLANGKLDRAALPAPSAASNAGPAAAGRAPATAAERTVLDAMRAVLGAPDLGPDDDFFVAGGHSLLAAQLAARLERDTGAALSLRSLFEAPTAARLARLLDGGVAAPTCTITRREDREWAPLSLMQQRLWVLEQMEPGGVTWNTPSAHRLHGEMDLPAFQAAFAEVVRRQPSLRTRIVERDGEAMQRIEMHADATLPVEDLSGLPDAQREKRLHERLEQLTAQPFNLELGPLYRARLFRLAADDHVLFFMPHHIVWDGWSFDLLYAEMSALYDAFQRGRPSPLPELAIDYGDFSRWHLDWLKGDELASQMAYWTRHLHGHAEPLNLPTDRPRPAQASGEGATEWLSLDLDTTERLRAFGTQCDATLFMTLLTGWYALLASLSGQDDLVVGLPVRNRDRGSMEPVMGFFVNALPMRMQLRAGESFRDLLRRVRAQVIEALAHPDVPFEQLLRELKVARDTSRSPVYQALFSFQDARARQTHWGNLRHEHVLLFQKGAANDLGLWFLEHGQGLSGGLAYNTDILDARSAKRFVDRLKALLDNALARPDAPLSELDARAPDDRTLVDAANATAQPMTAGALHDVLLGALQAGATTRVQGEHGSLDAAQLVARSGRIAAALQARGVRPGDHVGVAVARSADLPAVLLGILRTGAAYVPLDPGFPEARLRLMTDDAQLVQIVGDAALAARLDWPRAKLLDTVLDEGEIASAPDGRDVAVDPESACYLIYTSGSTGTPKGVRVPHRAVVNFLASMQREPGLARGDTLVAVTTVSFDIAVLELYLPLLAGARLVVATRDVAQDANALAALLRDSNATVMQATPSTWRMLLDAGWTPARGFRALCGGEPLAPDLAAQLLQAGAEVWNLYGPTETTVWSTCARIVSADDVHIGTPIANTEVHILDAHGQRCAPGVPGELVIGGQGVALGYHRRDALTAERFIEDRYSARPAPTGRCYRTGDLARWRLDGRLEHLGRLDHQVKLRGHRIELGEIEAALLEDAGVGRAVATVREDRPGDLRLVAYVVPAGGQGVDAETVLAALRARLPSYMVPQHLVVLDALPLLPNGKTDRNALPSPLARMEPASARTAVPADPRLADPRVAYLVALWTELLGVAAGPSDNFFDLGGHSMLAVQMSSRVARDTGVRLKLMRLVSQDLSQVAQELPAPGATPTRAADTGRLSRLRRLFARGR